MKFHFGMALLLSVLAHSAPAAEPPAQKPLRVAVVGAHPDDPESGTGGLILQLTQAKHEVHVAYAVTHRQGRKYFDKPERDVRHAEAEAACKVLGATPHFFDYAAEQLFVDTPTVQKIGAWLDELKPDVVLTHWPVDTHPDHSAISTLVWRAYKRGSGWNLYYFEVNAGHQTLAFKPELYLDVEPVREKKREALFMHKSQDPNQIWTVHHDPMHKLRGTECGLNYAEAYLLVEAKPGAALLPVEFRKRRN